MLLVLPDLSGFEAQRPEDVDPPLNDVDPPPFWKVYTWIFQVCKCLFTKKKLPKGRRNFITYLEDPGICLVSISGGMHYPISMRSKNDHLQEIPSLKLTCSPSEEWWLRGDVSFLLGPKAYFQGLLLLVLGSAFVCKLKMIGMSFR